MLPASWPKAVSRPRRLCGTVDNDLHGKTSRAPYAPLSEYEGMEGLESRLSYTLRRFREHHPEENAQSHRGCVALIASRDAFLTAAIGWMPVLVVRVCGDQVIALPEKRPPGL